MAARAWLRPNVQIEPLWNRWYAWSHLVSPATAAMNAANGHAKILKSYVSAPEVHAAAVKNPEMLGGPFVDYEGGRVAEIEALLERSQREQAPLHAFAAGVKALDELLAAEAKGTSMEPLYARVPEPLRGYVELVYDLGGAPRVRFLEPLLYRSPLYDVRAQSLSLSVIEQDHRPFALSTPRLASPSRIDVPVRFAAEAVDLLCGARSAETAPGGVDVSSLAEALGVEVASQGAFARLFTEEAPAPRPAFTGEGVRVRYLGHASVLLESKETTVLVDPTLSYGYAAEPARFTYADLPPRIDFVVITHNHQDHLLLETLLQIRHRVGTVVVPRGGSGALQDPSLRLALRAIGFPRVVELDVLESIDIPGGRITGLPFLGEHADLDIATKLAHLVELGSYRALFAADSDNVEPRLYDHVKDVAGDLTSLFVGMECDGAPLSWLYGPLLTRPITRKVDQSRRLSGSDAKKALAIVDCLRPREVFVYAMGQEPWLGYVMSVRYTPESKPIVESDALVRACAERDIRAERLYARMERVYAP